MDECCTPRPPDGYDREFDARFARRLAKRYRREGLTPSARLILEFAESVGLEGSSVLEIGGGIGDIQLEMLKRGASRTTNVELSRSYEAEASRLLDESGLHGRVARMLGIDLAATPDAVPRADIVVLHRVVCCYPDYERLLSAAAGRAQRAVVFSHPTRNLAALVSTRVINLYSMLTGCSYRAFAHAPDAMAEVLNLGGFVAQYRRSSAPWHVVGTVRG